MPSPRNSTSVRRDLRSGFSLIEVIVAMAICMLGLAAVLQMSNLSQRFARKATETIDLQILCQNRVNELLAGLLPLENATDQPCPENEQFMYSIDVDLREQLPLALVVVTVQPAKDGAGKQTSRSTEVAERVSRKRELQERQFTLRRWIATRDQKEKEQTSEATQATPQPGLPRSSDSNDEDRP
ncbi:MAG: prepilin-type N-terminal cleavage/methylation domain-containing protein [Planctomycetota bacterium]